MKTFSKEISEIDSHINAGKYNNALLKIDELLEFPQKNGEIYWRKLLASQNCKNDNELLCKGKILENNSAFINAIKFADKNERTKYELFKKNRDLIAKVLKKELNEKEVDEKRKTDVEKLLPEYRQKLDSAEKLTQENIGKLEKIEKSIREQIIDLAVIAEEYKHTLEDILSGAKNIGNTSKNEISEAEKNAWFSELDIALAASNAELQHFEETKSTHSVFNEYRRLVKKEQEIIVSEIKRNIADMSSIRSQIQNLADFVELTSKKYANAKEKTNAGSYTDAISLLSQERFKEIVIQAMTKAKSERG